MADGRVTVRLSGELLAAVERLAVVERRSVSDVVRQAVEARVGAVPVPAAVRVGELREKIASVPPARPVQAPVVPAGWDVDPLDDIA